jgi:hypothetical protein
MATRQERIEWLLIHRYLWEGYNEQSITAEAMQQNIKIQTSIFRQMKQEGLLGKKTIQSDCAIWKWIKEARRQRRYRAAGLDPDAV